MPKKKATASRPGSPSGEAMDVLPLPKTDTASSCMPRGSKRFVALAVVAAAAMASQMDMSGTFSGDILKGLSSNSALSLAQLQIVVGGFCLSPLPGRLLGDRSTLGGQDLETTGGNFSFADDGDIENDEYTKGSIYSLLYALYKGVGEVVSEKGITYQFTFNTWGIADSPVYLEQTGAPSVISENDPQRHGKQAYAGLVKFQAVRDYMRDVNPYPRIIEIGCGTGAGANLITGEVLPTANYTAYDMQKAAIDTCQARHAFDKDNLQCVHVPGGVGNGDNKVPNTPDNSVDFVIVSETHIADIEVGPEERAIFSELIRVVKPGGLFLWGNALPTRVWLDAINYLDSVGMELVHSFNHTKAAVLARDQDEARVNSYCQQIFDKLAVFSFPYFGPRCQTVSDRLIKNFYRHPGTALYLKMVTGYDSYMHLAFRKTDRATTVINEAFQQCDETMDVLAKEAARGVSGENVDAVRAARIATDRKVLAELELNKKK